MGRDIPVPLFETTVFDNVMQVVPSNNNGPLHLGRLDQAFQDTATNGNITDKGALLVDVVSFDGGIWCLDAKTHVTNETHGLLLGAANNTLSSNKNGILLLVSLFVL